MKLKEWKKFLDSIPDNDYTRKLDYTQFKEAAAVDATNSDSKDCFVLLNGEMRIDARHAENKGFIDAFKTNVTGDLIIDRYGDIVYERLFGDVKIIKYEHKP